VAGSSEDTSNTRSYEESGLSLTPSETPEPLDEEEELEGNENEHESVAAATGPAAAPSAAADLDCYEVSEAEFKRLLEAGAVVETNDSATSPQYWQISEEEFQQLMQAGQLFPTSSDDHGDDMSGMDVYEVTDEQFEQMMAQGAVVQTQAGKDSCEAVLFQKEAPAAAAAGAATATSATPSHLTTTAAASATATATSAATTAAGGSIATTGVASKAVHASQHHDVNKKPEGKDQLRHFAPMTSAQMQDKRRPRSVDCALITKAKSRRDRGLVGGGLFFLPMDALVGGSADSSRSGSAASSHRSGSSAPAGSLDSHLLNDQNPSRLEASQVAAGAPMHSVRLLREMRPRQANMRPKLPPRSTSMPPTTDDSWSGAGGGVGKIAPKPGGKVGRLSLQQQFDDEKGFFTSASASASSSSSSTAPPPPPAAANVTMTASGLDSSRWPGPQVAPRPRKMALASC